MEGLVAKEQQPWRDMDGDKDSPFLERSFKNAGMEEVDPKYVTHWNAETGEALFAMDPENHRISWDPRYFNSSDVKKWLKETYARVEREERRKNKGFGY